MAERTRRLRLADGYITKDKKPLWRQYQPSWGLFAGSRRGFLMQGRWGEMKKLDKQAKPAIMPQAKEEGGRISQNGNQTAGRGRRNNEFGRAARHR
ncbi:MAG: hypothetical protein DBY17_05390 [Oscillospiraceae bacterium]|nr:MAG: hypothetical protein DBY17_05390 [Oscillospiraceae bacterium]